MGRFRTLRGERSWVFVVALAVTSSLVAPLVFGLFDGTEPLTHFRDRAIGITTLEGVDASGYAHNYVWMTSATVVSFLLLFVAFAWLDRFLAARTGELSIENELAGIARLAEISIVLVALRIVFRQESLSRLSLVALHLAAAIALVIGLRILAARRGAPEGVAALLSDHRFLVASLAFPLPFYFGFWTVFEKKMTFGGLPVTAGFSLYLLVLAAILAAYAAAVRKRSREAVRRANARTLVAAVPLLLIPLAIPLVNELQYSFPDVTAKTAVLVAMAVLAAASAAAFALAGRGLPEVAPARLLHYVYFPLFVATNAIFKAYRPTLYLGGLDYFHMGEATVPTQQLFHFGAVPLIDLRPAHTLSDLFYQTLYTLVHGYHGMDMLLWTRWMPPVVALVVIYFFLARLVSPVFALVATTLAPVLAVVTSYYSLVLVPPLFLCAAIRRPTVGRFVLLWASAAVLTLWRFDFGLVAWVALAGVLAVWLYGRPGRVKAPAVALAIVAAASALAVAALALAAHHPAWETLVFLVKSYTYRLATRTRADVIREYSTVAVLQYYVLPAVSVFYVIYFALRRLVRRRYVSPGKYMLVFVAVFSLVISLRSLERHSLLEGFNPHLFVFSLACLPFLLLPTGAGRESAGRRAAFFAVALANAFFWLPPSSYAKGTFFHLLRLDRFFELRDWEADEKRVFYDTARHEELVQFLDDQLNDGETFYDFTNSPLLYVLADKRFPTFVIPNLIQTSETIQRHVLADLEALRAEGRLPFVIFKQGGRFWDNVDGVPNEIRSYRIAEFVYRHWKPLATIGTYQVWIDKSRPDADALLAAYTERQPLELAENPRLENLRRIDTGDGALAAFRALGEDPHVSSLFRLDDLPRLAASRYWELRLRFRVRISPPPPQGALQIFFQTDGSEANEEASAWVDLAATPPGQAAEVEVPIRTRPSAVRLTDLRFDPPAGSELEILEAEIVRRGLDWKPIAPEDVAQSFDLGRLPYVWGSHDPLQAASRTAVQAELVDRPVVLASGEELSLRIDPAVDKTSGNYLHLRMKPAEPVLEEGSADDEPRLAIDYGEPPASSFELTLDPGSEDDYERYPLERKGTHEAHNVDSFTLDEGRRIIYEAVGDDPYVHALFDFAELPALAAGDDVYLHLHYRASRAGALQIFFGYDESWFDADDNVMAEIVKTSDYGEPERLVVPLPPGRGGRLTDLRFDFPDGSLFEVVSAEVVWLKVDYADYLVRLSTQWRWTSRDVDELRLRALGAPVAIERAWLRRGDEP